MRVSLSSAIFMLIIVFTCNAQQDMDSIKRMNVYLIHGQGSDSRLFKNLSFDERFLIKNISLPIPEKQYSMKQYAAEVLKSINTDEPCALIGVSLGGMVCTELADLHDFKKIIIVSSAKCRSELPLLYRFQKYLPLKSLVPGFLFKVFSRVLQPIIEPDRRKEKETCRAMLKDKKGIFLKRTSNLIVKWDRKNFSSKIIHIHGTNDHTLPGRIINANYWITNGSHMMILTQSEGINSIITGILSDF